MSHLRFVKKNMVCIIAAVIALITCFFVTPDKQYIDYFDINTLVCLFLTLAVVCALRNIKFFTILARRLVMITGNLRNLFIMLICITFLGSMLIANDMALITFLPLGYFALTTVKAEKHMAYLFVLQNISANLGGMLTPFGNPQNLYLYSYFKIPTGEFCGIMLPHFLIAVSLLLLACMLVKPLSLNINEAFGEKLNLKKTVIYLIIFAVSLLVVFRIIPFLVCLITIPVIIYFFDKDALKMVDYGLLLTFIFFFIFAGNLARIETVNTFLSNLLAKNTLLVSVGSCQFISNVPSSVLLSKFTTDYSTLLVGVNIGGCGTIISSLASLITFSEFRILYPGHAKQYFALFTVINIVFLTVMTFAASIIC